MKDGEATVSAGKTAFFPARAGALMGLLAATGLLSLPLQAAFDPPDAPSAAVLPVIDRNFAGVVAVGDDDVLKVAEARLVRVAEGAPKEPNPPERAAEGLGVAPEPWPARELSLVERVQDWLARANREFQTVIVRRLSVAPPGGGGDDIAKKLEQVKDEDAEAAQAKQAAEAQRRKEAADALKLAEETRKERERLAAESKRAAEARERAERVAEDQKRSREEEHQRALADAASKAADDAKRAEQAAERQAKLAAAEAQRRAEQEAEQAAAAKEAEEKARAAAAAREAERERIAREDAEKAAQAEAARTKLAEERAKQEAAAKEAADRQRAADDAARAAALKAAEETAKAAAASSSPAAKQGAPVAFELHDARKAREARNTRLARGPVVQPWMRRMRHERPGREGRCENAGRRISLPGHYVVARGDTLWQIALRHYRSGLYFMRIYRANRDVIRNPNVIYACERLYLPRR